MQQFVREGGLAILVINELIKYGFLGIDLGPRYQSYGQRFWVRG